MPFSLRLPSSEGRGEKSVAIFEKKKKCKDLRRSENVWVYHFLQAAQSH